MGERNRFRWAWWLLAYAALGLGLVGIFVPGLPTVPFILLSAFAAARGSTRLEQQLLDDPRFGPLIRDWQRDGSVPRRAKWLATAAMTASALLLVNAVKDAKHLQKNLRPRLAEGPSPVREAYLALRQHLFRLLHALYKLGTTPPASPECTPSVRTLTFKVPSTKPRSDVVTHI